MNSARGCAPDSEAAIVAVNGAGESAERGETVNSDIEPADSATVSIEGEGQAN